MKIGKITVKAQPRWTTSDDYGVITPLTPFALGYRNLVQKDEIEQTLQAAGLRVSRRGTQRRGASA